MTANMYYKCKICGCVCNLKYQMGYARKHPITYKCMCGISIRGTYEENRRMEFENAVEVEEQVPGFVVYCSGEFFTVPPFKVTTFEETIATCPPPFILATQLLDYEEYRKEFSHVLSYRDQRHTYVRALNELYAANNYEKVKELIREKFDPNEEYFPLNNEADYVRATTMINQFQFLNYDGVNRTPKTTGLVVSTIKRYPEQFRAFLDFVKEENKLEVWKNQIHNLCDQVYEKIDLLMPAVSIDFIRESEKVDLDFFAITTTSFEEIKQLYVDLYELIGRLLVLAIGIDNILIRGEYTALKIVPGLNVDTWDKFVGMRNKGNIIKFIDVTAPVESLIGNSLNSDIRNSIGHYSYVSHEVADSFGQIIEFKDKENIEKRSLLQLCYDIWQMYKTLGIFNEIIHHFEIQLLATEGKFPSYAVDPFVRNKILSTHSVKKKIYPNDPCPCGSGLKYKKCCGKN